MAEASQTIIRFSAPGLPGVMFTRRPVSIAPEEGTVCLVDNGDRNLKRTRQGVGVYSGGAWTNGRGKELSFVPSYWTELDLEARK